MNESTMKGKWAEFKGEILDTWGKLKGDNLDRTKGNLKAIAGLIEQEYGEAREQVMERLHKISERFASPHAEENPVTQYTADKSEQAKNAMRDAVSQKEIRKDTH